MLLMKVGWSGREPEVEMAPGVDPLYPDAIFDAEDETRSSLHLNLNPIDHLRRSWNPCNGLEDQ